MQNLKISILDAFTCSRNDLNWSAIEKFGELSVYERTSKSQIVERAFDSDIILTNKVPLFKEQLDALPNLKYIGILATGYNNVDLQETRRRKIPVSNVPAYGTDSVAQAVFAHILNISNRVQTHADAVAAGEWSRSPDICFCLTSQTELSGKTLGVIGYGAIGRRVAQIGRAFNMKVIAFAPSKLAGASDAFAQFESLDKIFEKSDIISLNCPLNNLTEKIINNQNLSKMKDGVWLINTGRGALVDEDALALALKSGKVAAAGLDVLSVEPPPPSNPLIGLSGCFITPHNAWTSIQARSRLINIVAGNISSWIDGSPTNIVNG